MQVEGAIGGVFIGGAKVAWYPDPLEFDYKNTVRARSLSLRYALRTLRAPVALATFVAGTYTGVECLVEQLRDETKSSTYVNSAVAGAAAGVVMASVTKRFDVMATTALSLGMLMGMVEYNGQTQNAEKEYTAAKWGKEPPKVEETSTVEDLKKKYPEYKHL